MPNAPQAAHDRARYVRKGLRIAWNVVTVSETGRRYPERARQVLWTWLSSHHPDASVTRAYGQLLHRRNRTHQERHPEGIYTFFLRNPVQFAVLGDIARAWPASRPLRVACVGCSTGAELYSALWTIRQARPDVRATGMGVDISDEALDMARAARYPLTTRELRRLSGEEIDGLVRDGLFAREADAVVVTPNVTRDTIWVNANAVGAPLADQLGAQDVVFANNILCHYHDDDAATGLENIVSLVAPGGVLFVQGIDLDVKTRVALALGLEPQRERLEELYRGDPRALVRWPVTYWGPEPIDRRRSDWVVRYATVFRRPDGGVS